MRRERVGDELSPTSFGINRRALGTARKPKKKVKSLKAI